MEFGIMPKRKASWAIIVWTALIAIWIYGGISDRASQDCPAGDELCVGASDVGTSIGITLLSA